MRKLASIQIIKDLKPIPDADRIEVASVLGWNIVVEKNKYKVGEPVVYFEIDSFLPCVEDYEFLRSSSYKNSPILGEGFRIKTKKLRGVISQGLIMPIEVCFKDCMPLPGMGFEIGEDVTELLNVKKWEEPEPAVLGGDMAGRRPDFIKKTDETRIQACPELLEEFYNCPMIYATTKIDGSSHSIAIDRDDRFRMTSHNMELRPSDKVGSFPHFCVENDLESKLRELKSKYGVEEIVVQGEFYGPGIQKNKLGAKKPGWKIFTVDLNGHRQDLDVSLDIAGHLETDRVSFVPIVWKGTGEEFKKEFPDEETLLKAVEGDCANVYEKHQNEGWVIRPVKPQYSKLLDTSLSMKVINNRYLLKE